MYINTIIVDDEEFAREELVHQLSIYEEINITHKLSNGSQALKIIKDIKPELIFLDIEMPGMKGIDLAEILNSYENYSPYIVFVTAYNTFAIEAFKFEVKDYLLKPLEPKRFSLSIKKIIKHFNSLKKYEKNIIAKTGNKSNIIKTNEISFITVDNSVVYIFVGSQAYTTTYRSLDEIEKLLDPNIFIRIHRTYIVNTEKVSQAKQLQSGLLNLKIIDYNESSLPVSRAKIKVVKKILNI